ncbi:hypothetical protein [Xanthomonas campestris]|uniref:hypothetical protein n=1 Tax=Xanthomonas campestris TaxID=339 RepID=UPI001EDDFE11|nr:hypothetical protein [Xanthomonas campestris]
MKKTLTKSCKPLMEPAVMLVFPVAAPIQQTQILFACIQFGIAPKMRSAFTPLE